MKHREIRDRLIGRSGVLIRLVVHHGDVKLVLCRHLLHQGVTAIDKRLPVSVPVHYKCRDSHSLGMANLALDHRRIVGGIANGDVPGMPEPCLIHGDDLRRVSVRSISQLRGSSRSIRDRSNRAEEEDRNAVQAR